MRLFTPTGVSIEVSDELGAALLKRNYRSREAAPKGAAPASDAAPKKPRAPRKTDSD